MADRQVPSPARSRFEAASRPALMRMKSLPAFVVPATLGVLLFLGLSLTAAWSGVLLVLVAALLAWLTAVSWPAITTGSKVMRVAVDLAVLVLGVLKLLGRI